MQPSNIGAPILVVPLNHTWHKNFQPLEANSEVPVGLSWFEGSDVDIMIQQPRVHAHEIDTAMTPVKPRVLNPLDFMKGGL